MRINNANIARLLAFKGVRHLLDTVGFVHLDIAGDPVFMLPQSASLDPLQMAIRILHDDDIPSPSSATSPPPVGLSAGHVGGSAVGAPPAIAVLQLAAAPASPQVDSWTCPACTFHNESGASCHACYENRPGTWPCPLCQMINVPARLVCKEEGCQGRRPHQTPHPAPPGPHVQDIGNGKTAGAATSIQYEQNYPSPADAATSSGATPAASSCSAASSSAASSSAANCSAATGECKAQAAGADRSDASIANGEWQSQVGSGGWLTFPPAIARMLEMGWNRMRGDLKYQRDGVQYTVDFQAMTQTRVDGAGAATSIRRIAPQAAGMLPAVSVPTQAVSYVASYVAAAASYVAPAPVVPAVPAVPMPSTPCPPPPPPAVTAEPCPHGCGASCRPAELAAHMEVCPRMQMACPRVGCGQLIARGDLDAHKVVCPGVWLRCPGCAGLITRRDAGAHWLQCTELPVLCAACDKLCTRGSLGAHQMECVMLHEPPPPPLPERRFDCPVCGENEPADGSFTAGAIEEDVDGNIDMTNCCDHMICHECCASYAANQIGEMKDGEEPVVKCFHPECNVHLTPDQIRMLNTLEAPIKLSDDMFQKYTRIDGVHNAKQLPGFQACPGGCGWGVVPQAGQQFLRCEASCAKVFCLHCVKDGVEPVKCDHGNGVSCEAHKLAINHRGAADERKTEAYMRERTKPCPGCKVPIAKEPDLIRGETHTCMKMYHRGCTVSWPPGTQEATHFCWCCLAPQRPIFEHDMSFHKKECLYWVAPQADDEGNYGKYESKCPNCISLGSREFCNQRAESACTREQNGSLETFESHFCACRHGCPCNSQIRVRAECTCGTDGGPSNECRCGQNLVA